MRLPVESPQAERRRLGGAIVLAVLVVIGVVTLWPGDDSDAGDPWWCLVCEPEYDIPNLALNVALFAPLGVGLALCGFGRGAAIAIALSATLVVEALQYQVIAGRDASLGDVLANALGAALGFWWAAHRSRRGSRPERSRRGPFSATS
jgi:hypothetical protein